MADQDTPSQSSQEAVEQNSPDHSEPMERARCLGDNYLDKYFQTQDMTDLDAAIQRYQEYLLMTQLDEDREGLLTALGNEFNTRYITTKQQSYSDTAIILFQELVDRTPLDHRHHSFRFHYLATAYRDRFTITRDEAAIDAAIKWYKQSAGHEKLVERYALRMGNLAAGYRDKFLRNSGQTTARADREAAIQLFQKGLDHLSSTVQERYACAKELFPLYADYGSWHNAYAVAKTAIHLIPLMATRDYPNDVIQIQCIEFAGLASLSAAMTLYTTNDLLEAIQLLELGRGVLSKYLSERHADVSTSLKDYPDIQRGYIDLRNRLYGLETSGPDGRTLENYERLLARAEALRDMEELTSKIRHLPGLKNFMVPPGKAEFQNAAKHGPICIINVTKYRCDAIIIEADGLRHRALLKLKSDSVKVKARKGDFSSVKTLEWMWDVIAHPVLEALGITEPSADGKWPHIWWIPTGLLAKFPLHAAGYHKPKSSRTVLDLAMSSYSLSVRTIIDGRATRDPAAAQLASPKALLMAIPNTSGKDPLCFATREVAAVCSLCKSMKWDPIQPGQRKADIIEYLPQCQIFHFAGHGHTDTSNPLWSYLLMEGGERDVLTVETLLDMNIQQYAPFLAYLSACGTGEINDETFLDESVHLISAFQISGFRHVIGTLWKVNDKICAEVASITYGGIRDGLMTDESVCLGLHQASRKLRNDWIARTSTTRGVDHELAARHDANGSDKRDDHRSRHIGSGSYSKSGLSNWVPYVHFGV